MDRELMWIYGLIDEKDRQEIADICLEANRDIGMSDRFFRFPLHISFKRSFYTDDFQQIKAEVKKMLLDHGPFNCRSKTFSIRKDMIWLELKDCGQIEDFHHLLDRHLKERFKISQDGYDLDFHPHITLFRDDDEKRLARMIAKLGCQKAEYGLKIDRFAIGSRKHDNEFF